MSGRTHSVLLLSLFMSTIRPSCPTVKPSPGRHLVLEDDGEAEGKTAWSIVITVQKSVCLPCAEFMIRLQASPFRATLSDLLPSITILAVFVMMGQTLEIFYSE